MKVVINRCFGGFSLSKEAYEYLGLKWDEYGYLYNTKYEIKDDKDRANLDLVHCVEELGEKANGWFANLKVVDVPDDIKWYIDNYDGSESVCEEHRVWW